MSGRDQDAGTGGEPGTPLTSWIEAAARIAAEMGQTPVALSAHNEHLVAGLRQFGRLAAEDPVLRATEGALNANPLRDIVPVDWAEIARALRMVWLRSMRDPRRAINAVAEFQLRQWRTLLDISSDALQRWSGALGGEPVGQPAGNGRDKRFAAPEWHDNPVFRSLKEVYLLASDWLMNQAREGEDLTAAERQYLEFHLTQFVNAMSPNLMLLSNPVALRRALETGGASLADGTRHLLADLKEGRLSMVDADAFRPGHNLAVSPGKVVYRNALIELIQYAPKTPKVRATPLLILPPWINRFYILDLQPKNSMVRHLVEAGFTVFMVSWRNPDATMEDTTIDDYVDLAPLAASDAIRAITGSATCNVMGYCIGGTLLAMTLAHLSAKHDDRFNAVTFMVSMQDFAQCGDTALFLGESASVDFIEQQMLERGYLDSREMSNMFSLLRSNDLIWANVVNNYLMGQKPPAFDLLYWNSDGTRMARAAHAWYLRNTYVENNLVVPGKVTLKGEPIDLGRIKQDIFAIGAEKDHIVPWQSAGRVATLVGGDTTFVLASSGHVAGIINPPGGKGTYWTGDAAGLDAPAQWRAAAERHDGSWWPLWFDWLAARAGEEVAPPRMGGDAHPPLVDAPGSYVLEK